MAITNGQTADDSDFISTSSGAGDSGKVPKLDANGKIAVGFRRSSGGEASSSTPTPTAGSVEQWNETALATGATFAAPTGSPVDGQTLVIRIKDNGTARSLAWNAVYRASTNLPLPTTTILGKTLYLGFVYNSADSKWDLLALLNNF